MDEELIAAKNKDTFDELRDDVKFMDDLRRRLAERDAEPHLVSLFVHVDDSAENTRELLVAEDDYDAPPLLSPPIDELISALTERGPYPVLPRALTVSITNKRLEEVLSAPRCLLVAVDPGVRPREKYRARLRAESPICPQARARGTKFLPSTRPRARRRSSILP